MEREREKLSFSCSRASQDIQKLNKGVESMNILSVLFSSLISGGDIYSFFSSSLANMKEDNLVSTPTRFRSQRAAVTEYCLFFNGN